MVSKGSAHLWETPKHTISYGRTAKNPSLTRKKPSKGYLEVFPEELDQLKRKRELIEITI
ncbi:MAG: hypothetical protein ABSD42_03915 [Candidatus Bathyarchaeia archaeon]|jgi:hypothetical protein